MFRSRYCPVSCEACSAPSNEWPCANFPCCAAGGNCVDLYQSAACVCNPGFSGTDCSVRTSDNLALTAGECTRSAAPPPQTEPEPGCHLSQGCHQPIDCVGDWQPWTDCDRPCGPGHSQRFYSITSPAQFGGVECDVLDTAAHDGTTILAHEHMSESRACQIDVCRLPPSPPPPPPPPPPTPTPTLKPPAPSGSTAEDTPPHQQHQQHQPLPSP